MASLLECLNSLPSDLPMRDLAAVRDATATVAQHIARLHLDEDGYEVREERRNYGRRVIRSIGIIGGPALFREVSQP